MGNRTSKNFSENSDNSPTKEQRGTTTQKNSALGNDGRKNSGPESDACQKLPLELHNEELRRVQEELAISRTKFSKLYDFAPVAYFTFDARGVILEVNLTGATLIGIERQLLVNSPFVSLIADAESRDRFAGHLENVVQQPGMQRCEIRLSAKNGSVIHGQFQSVLMGDFCSAERQILSSIIDGTSAKQLETEIQDAREYAENIVETVHKPLVVLDSNLKILTANVSFFDTFKATPSETIGKFIFALGNGQWNIPKLRVLFEDILPNNTVFNNYEVDHEFPGIGRKVILLNARQIFRKNIGSHIILLAMEDITARKLIEAERSLLDQILQDKNLELERARLIADKANLAKSEFLSNMSHELRTPLSAILGFAQMMETGTPEPSDSQKRSIEQILKAGWYLLKLINEILDLAQIESGRLAMSLGPVSLAEVLHECEAMVVPQARNRGVNLIFTHFDVPCFVKADRTRIKQVLINLLSNAIKYNHTGGTVAVENALTSATSIRISVRDNGEGLAPEQLSQLFQPFNRLGKESSDEQGTGIGLVVSKHLIELMGGVIGVESTVGVGSVFWIELHLTTETQAEAVVARAESLAPQLSLNDAVPHTLLYVEDNPANLMLVEEIIARRPDINLLSAGDGISGIEIARASLPDVILMDISLPGISGIDALKILATDQATSHIPVIALSANAMSRDIEKGLEAGFFRYLTKPIKINEFMSTLDEAMKFARQDANRAANEEQS